MTHILDAYGPLPKYRDTPKIPAGLMHLFEERHLCTMAKENK